MLSRISYLFQVTTNPADVTAAIAHSGGWSEQFWLNYQVASSAAGIQGIARFRAQLLPGEASIVGARIAYYDIDGNKLMPKGSQTVKFTAPGNSANRTDLPQVSLECNGTSSGASNASRFRLRCIPDAQMIGGEYQPTAAFKRLVTTYLNNLASFPSLGFIGRNLSNPSARVLSIAANLVSLDGAIGAVPNTSYIRFNRVFDNNGKPIQGIYRVVAIPAPGQYQVVGLDNITAGSNGTARVDALQFFDYEAINVVRAVVKKIGRPFESYRGRASKRRVR